MLLLCVFVIYSHNPILYMYHPYKGMREIFIRKISFSLLGYCIFDMRFSRTNMVGRSIKNVISWLISYIL